MINVNNILIEQVITPRLVVSVYNQKGKTEELLGSCQVIIINDIKYTN